MLKEEYDNHIERRVFSKNGKPVTIRSLKATDESMIQEFFGSLSPRSIFLRFLSHWDSVPPHIIEDFLNIDYTQNVGLIALEKSPEGECCLGLCCVFRIPDSPKGEFAVVIRDQWQGLGVGAELLKASLPIARAMEIEELWGIASPENTMMLALALKLGFTVLKEYDQIEMGIHLSGRLPVL